MFLKKLDSDHNLLMLFDSPVMQDGCIQITESEYEQLREELDILANGTYSYRGMIKKQEQFRDFRSRQFAAFDIYKSNIDYGIIEETEEERDEIISWYLLMLEFPDHITEENYDTIIFPETPAIIRSYIDGGEDSAQEVTLTKMASTLKMTKGVMLNGNNQSNNSLT
jgi:hypothetical protein